jgi:hypothetical protein
MVVDITYPAKEILPPISYMLTPSLASQHPENLVNVSWIYILKSLKSISGLGFRHDSTK